MPTYEIQAKTEHMIKIRKIMEGVKKMKRTVLVEFVNNFGAKKKYAFNIASECGAVLAAVKVGTVFSVKSYSNDFVVTDYLDDTFEYVNIQNGDLKHKISNTNDKPLVEIDLDKLSKVVSFVEA